MTKEPLAARLRSARLLPAVAVACAGLTILLAVQIAMDPNVEVTGSNSPFTDEGWSVLGARNAVLACDAWQRGETCVIHLPDE